MTFYQALDKILEGERVTRLEWADEGTYCLMIDSILHIRTENKIHQWIIHEADMIPNDWVLV